MNPRFASWITALLLSTQGTETNLEETVRRLDANDINERAAAQTQLESIVQKLGPAGRETLKKLASGSSAEVKARLQEQIRFLDQVEDCQQFTSVFDRLSLPSIGGRKFVLYNTGQTRPYMRTRIPSALTLVGWVLEETEAHITLFEDRLDTQKLIRPRLPPNEVDRFDRTYPWLKARPGEYEVLDFRRFCDEFLLVGRHPRPTQQDQLSPGVAEALYAYWALNLGFYRQAIHLTALSRRMMARADGGELKEDPPQSLSSRLARHFAGQAAGRALRGAPFSELDQHWQVVADLLPAMERAGAQRMSKHYKDLTVSASAATTPEPKEAPLAAAWWIERLSEASGEQWISVSGGYVSKDTIWNERQGGVNPCLKLLELGSEAIPELIRHFDDPRPTRCLRGRHTIWSGAGDNRVLFRYGDLCQSIFFELTYFESRDYAGLYIGDLPQDKVGRLKAAASAWWAEKKDKLADHFLELLKKGDDRSQPFAVSRLIRIDRKTYLPRILDVATKPESPYRGLLLKAAGPALGKEHQGLLEGLLKDESFVVLTVSRILWERCGSSAGIAELLSRTSKPDADRSSFPIHAVLGLLCELPADDAVEAVCRLLESADKEVLEELFALVDQCADPRVASTLFKLLDNTNDSREAADAEHGCRIGDLAAHALTTMVGDPVVFRLYDTLAGRNAGIADLKAWWAKNQASLDWRELRKRSQTRATR